LDAARSLRWSGEPLEIGRRDGCYALHHRIETILGRLAARPPSPPGLPREELLARLAAATPGGGAST
jgi:hypothetical protein